MRTPRASFRAYEQFDGRNLRPQRVSRFTKANQLFLEDTLKGMLREFSGMAYTLGVDENDCQEGRWAIRIRDALKIVGALEK